MNSSKFFILCLVFILGPFLFVTCYLLSDDVEEIFKQPQHRSKSNLYWRSRMEREEVAQKVERVLFSDPEDPKIKTAVEILENNMRFKFAGILDKIREVEVDGEYESEILKVKEMLEQGKISFHPVLQNLPAILRNEGTADKFIISVFQILKEKEEEGQYKIKLRQSEAEKKVEGTGTGTTSKSNTKTTPATTNKGHFDRIMDAVGKFNLKEITQFILEVQDLVTTIEGIIGEIDI